MDRSNYLFEKIKLEGLTAIDEFIETRASEELFLDFKRSSNNGDSRRLSQIDRNNLAKAISGFGNSEGGIIIWGVDCSEDMDGADVARAKVPIQNPQRFLGNLQGAVSGGTIPPHNTVENYLINNPDGNSGFVITLIPKSSIAPHQVVGKLQYYIRVGSDFIPTPHQILSGMFGKRPQPKTFHVFTNTPAKNEGDTLIFEYGILIRNEGPGIATDLFLTSVISSTIGESSELSWKPSDPATWTGSVSFGNHISIISKKDIRLPPESQLQPLTLKCELLPPFTEPLKISGSVGCSGAPSYKFEITSSVDEIQAIYDEYFVKLNSNELTKSICHELSSRLFSSKSK